MNIFLIFDKNQNCTTGIYIYKELKRLNHNVKVFNHEEVRSNLSPYLDLILAIDYGAHYIFDVDFHPKAIWLIYTHLTFNCDKVMAETFDIIFVVQKKDYEKLKGKFSHVYWLPLAGDMDYHGKRKAIIKYDIAFVGKLGRGARKILLTELMNRYPNSFIGEAPCDQIGEIYSSSKIVVNYSLKNDVNMRVFEAAISGSLLITNQVYNNGLEELFEIGNEIVLYDGTLDDLIRKINYYLKHDAERNRIAENAFQKAINFHTYLHRVKLILEKVEQSKNLILCYCASKNVKVLRRKLKLNELILYLREAIDLIVSKIKETWLRLRWSSIENIYNSLL